MARLTTMHPPREQWESDHEYDERRGLVYLLTDETQEFARHAPVAIYTEPVLAIAQTCTNPETWHHFLEHYWEDSGRWELTPYVLNDPKEWGRDEFILRWQEQRDGAFGHGENLKYGVEKDTDEDWLRKAKKDIRLKLQQEAEAKGDG